MSASSRLKILSDSDIDHLYGLPTLNNHERQLLFNIEPQDSLYMNQLTSTPPGNATLGIACGNTSLDPCG